MTRTLSPKATAPLKAAAAARRATHSSAAARAKSTPPSASSARPKSSTPLSALLNPSFKPLASSSSSSSSSTRRAASHTAMPSTSSVYSTPRSSAQISEEVTEAVAGRENVERLQRLQRDFRSDTFTMPTDAQLLVSLRASRGDDVYHEDPTTAALEERIAKMTGKEAALFGASGTMTNQLAIRTHMKQPPHSVITDHRAHVHMLEAGGIAMFSQATTHGIVPSNGIHLTAEDIEPALQLGTNIHIAPTKLVCLENTLSGIVFPQEEVVRIGELVHKHDIQLHLDGARMWNVAAAEIERRGLNPTSEADRTAVLSDLLAPFDSASLCLSKGIGAPIGSAIVGTKEFIERARWFRKMFGGGIRQSGGIAASADYALTHHFPRLAGTHALARRLAAGLEAAGCRIVAPVDTSMVFFDPSPLGLSIGEICDSLAALPNPISLNANRVVLHHQTSPEAIDDFVAEVERLAAAVPAEKRAAGGASAVKLGY
ncbi:hypothetical protein Q8F55_007151 [Vanrija albida]|uniref:Aromatic amino acid beta-eliminating lyase/threonine aldolase domain-containing protein n=1 Tax=Vanrija albida TaxID=181172 RepID=A0ABR3Q021_9TREE